MGKKILQYWIFLAVCTFTLQVAVFLFQPASAKAQETTPPPKPNIILISTDDMGWGDFCGNNDPTNPVNVKLCGLNGPGTPELKSLAESGVTLTNFYTPTPICSPSRAALMTGQDPKRPQIYSALGGDAREKFLDQNFTTIAKILRDAASYNTAIIGKWHLGWDQSNICANGCNSWDHGFEYNYVLPLGIGQFHRGFCLADKYKLFPLKNPNDPEDPINYSNTTWRYINEILGPGQGSDQYYEDPIRKIMVLKECSETTAPQRESFSGFLEANSLNSLTRVLTEEAKAYIKNDRDLDPKTEGIQLSRNSLQPFFLYLAYPAPHAPLYIHLNQIIPLSITLESLKAGINKDISQCPAACSTINASTCGCLPKDVHSICETTPDRQKCEIALLYPSVIYAIDFNVGLVLDELNKEDPRNPGQLLKDNTIVIFTSDNGPYGGDAAQYPDYGRTGGLRGSKKFTYEGGVRVPFIARWPGKWRGILEDGEYIKLDQFADMMDVLPTLVTAAEGSYTTDSETGKTTYSFSTGKSIVAGKKPDGMDISNVLTGASDRQNKNIQISWFGNFPICVAWKAPGVCDDTCTASNGICDRSCKYVDAEGKCAGLPGYQPSFPFAIRTSEPLKLYDSIIFTFTNYKMLFVSDANKNPKPKELFDISTDIGRREDRYANLCLVNPAVLTSTNGCETYCTINDDGVATCSYSGTDTATKIWLRKYQMAIQYLWGKAYNYQKQLPRP